ncbi:MAG: hypothetical protein ABMA64_10160 [Myxococcota bacterium]
MTLLLSVFACATPAELVVDDFDLACRIATEEVARSALPPERAERLARRMTTELPAGSAVRAQVWPAAQAAAEAERAAVWTSAAPPGWRCPALTEGGEGPDERSLVEALADAPHPADLALELLAAHGQRWYGAAPPVGLARGQIALPPELACLGSADGAVALALAGCAPAGSALLARDEIAAGATKGRAAVALWLELHADEARKATKLHRSLTRSLLGGL